MLSSTEGAHSRRAAVLPEPPRLEMRSHEPNVTHATNASQAQMVNELLKNDALAAAYRDC
jgi:hypothetical protein